MIAGEAGRELSPRSVRWSASTPPLVCGRPASDSPARSAPTGQVTRLPDDLAAQPGAERAEVIPSKPL